ncbi:MAG: FtsQ-type POTRA domain-containing protein [Holosporaceae bacterium]|nr:FtsQ-type POTRA domain-containing protein [Holosporaceae bacterium]
MLEYEKNNKKTFVARAKKPLTLRLRLLFILLKSNLFLCSLFFGSIGYGYFFYFDRILTQKNDKFIVKKIAFDGNDKIPDTLLLKASELRYMSNIFFASLEDVKKKLEKVSWIRSAVVHRKFPDTIYIRVSERIPIAIFQSKYKLHLVDAESVVLEHDGIGNFSNLPIVVGDGAEKEAAHLLNCLDHFPKIRKQLIFALRVSKRRWNIKINKGITVKLPEKGLMQAVGILDELADSNGFFNDDILSIDLRMLDRVVISRKNEADSSAG